MSQGPEARPGKQGSRIEIGSFNRFSNDYKRAIVFAQDEVLDLRHASIDTGHLLLGVLHTGTARAYFEERGINIDRVRETLVSKVKPPRIPIIGDIPLSEDAKKAIYLSVEQANSLKDIKITTHHLLEALCLAGDSALVVAVLNDLNIDRSDLYDASCRGVKIDREISFMSEVLKRLQSIEQRMARIEQRLESKTDMNPAPETPLDEAR